MQIVNSLTNMVRALSSDTQPELINRSVVYVDAVSNTRSTFGDIESSAKHFGQALSSNWEWCKGDILALIAPNSSDIASIVFGTLYAGGVVCPLNHLSTARELAQSLGESNAKVIVTSISCLKVVQEAARIVGMPTDRILLMEDCEPRSGPQHFSKLRTLSKHAARPHINPEEDLAFLVYSSGTTGLPKGVMLTHRNVMANMMQNAVVSQEFLEWTRDRSLGFIPMYHIYGRFIWCRCRFD
jgi:4-coumarate--CoA ligase